MRIRVAENNDPLKYEIASLSSRVDLLEKKLNEYEKGNENARLANLEK